MPCAAPARGLTDAKFPWCDPIQNNPCGKPDFLGGLCRLHWQAANGQLSAISADPQTVLLLHGEEIRDYSSYAHPLAQGTAAPVQADTSQSKFGGSSLAFAGGFLSSPDSPDWNLGAGDFTVECWVNITNPATTTQVFVSQFTGNPGQYSWLLRYGANLQFYWSLDGTALQSYGPTWTPTAGTWYHVAAVRSGNNLMMFVNGVQIGTTQPITGALFDSPAPLTVGANPAGGWPFTGYLDEVRVSKGIARWTANFTPPTAPYS